ncbi:glycosyltransferase family 4 protein [Mycolicibacterium sp. Dal123E01]|uniref:glycosyltransferase family 4 protein n=1 Tax=Mycolicibacterium sp. Dal123E01 TaxID=3457578 RepID=UPI00403E8234
MAQEINSIDHELRGTVERRLIVDQFDPESPTPSGVDTCIRGLVRYCPANIELRIVGIDAVGDKKLGEWYECNIGGRTFDFMPVARLNPTDLSRRVPHSVSVALGLAKYRPARDTDIIQTHRINTGAVAMRLYPRAGHVQFIHMENNRGFIGRPVFRHFVSVYRWLERAVIPRSVDTVVFSRAGADRLGALSARVRFSPTWYDPAEFFPSESETAMKSRIIWAYRIEPGKNAKLAVDVMAALPERYTLTVAGSGSEESMMRQHARNSPAADRITFRGAVPKSEIGALMRSHDLMLMTSEFEGYSRAIVEGLASGLPVVTTPGGEPNGLVQTGVNGARVDTAAAELFVPAMEIASKVSASAARESVSRLSAVRLVPDVLTIP